MAVPSHFDEDALKKGIKTQPLHECTARSASSTGDPGFPGRSATNVQWLNFSPRLGLAWDVKGDGRTSVRFSAGTFYDYPASIYQKRSHDRSSMESTFALTNVKFDDSLGHVSRWRSISHTYRVEVASRYPVDPFSIVTAMDYDAPNMKVAQWNLSIQKQVGADWLFSASYLGNATSHLWTTQPLNNPVFLGLGPCTLNGVQYPTCSTTGNINQRRRLMLENPVTGQWFRTCQQGSIPAGRPATTACFSPSNAARPVASPSAETTRGRIASAISGRKSRKARTPMRGWSDPNNRRFDRGNCTTSQQRTGGIVFNLSGVAETPHFSNATRSRLASGWRFLADLQELFRAAILSITTNQDRALTGMASQRVNQMLRNPYGDKTVEQLSQSLRHSLCRHLARSEIWVRNSIVGPGHVAVRYGPFENIPGP